MTETKAAAAVAPPTAGDATDSDDSKNRISSSPLCQECRTTTAQYQCPACFHRTCSLQCCVSHKTRMGCTGKRNRAAFTPLCRMNDSILKSDYFFLEEVLDQIPRARKAAKMEHTDTSTVPSAGTNPKQKRKSDNSNSNFNDAKRAKMSRKLLQQATKRGISLQIMPSFMERHKRNTSWYSVPRDTITWKIEAELVPTHQKVDFTWSEDNENLRSKILQQFGLKAGSDSDDNGDNNNKDGEGYHLFVKRLPSKASSPRYVELDGHTSLRMALNGLTIIEHPTIYCVPTIHQHEFAVGTEMVVEQPTDML